jgi:hypothetical protein
VRAPQSEQDGVPGGAGAGDRGGFCAHRRLRPLRDPQCRAPPPTGKLYRPLPRDACVGIALRTKRSRDESATFRRDCCTSGFGGGHCRHAFTPVWDLGGVDLASCGAKMARPFSCRAYNELTGAPVLGLKFMHNGERW